MERIAKALRDIVLNVSVKLAQIEDAQASEKPSSNAWSKKEIIGHLIDSAANNHQRFVRAQIEASLVFPPYNQEDWVGLQAYNRCPWLQLVDLWKTYNIHLAWVIGQIPAGVLERDCTIGNNPTVSLGFLIEDYLTHLNLHLKQLGV